MKKKIKYYALRTNTFQIRLNAFKILENTNFVLKTFLTWFNNYHTYDPENFSNYKRKQSAKL